MHPRYLYHDFVGHDHPPLDLENHEIAKSRLEASEAGESPRECSTIYPADSLCGTWGDLGDLGGPGGPGGAWTFKKIHPKSGKAESGKTLPCSRLPLSLFSFKLNKSPRSP